MAPTPLKTKGTKSYTIAAEATWERAFTNNTGEALEVTLSHMSVASNATGIMLVQSRSDSPSAVAGHFVAGHLVPATTTNAGTEIKLSIDHDHSIYVRMPTSGGTVAVNASPRRLYFGS